MCGIIGIVGKSDVMDRLSGGLRRLEYRGYDSAGIATLGPCGIERRRAEGKLDNLVRVLADAPLVGHTGIAHTRWATHGAPSVDNAHPHATDAVALVHNGIIENFRSLRDELAARGRPCHSETDSEVIVHLVSERVEAGVPPVRAVADILPLLQGAFALAFLFRDHPDLLIATRSGSPLVVGYGDGEHYLGSDALALAPLTRRIAYLAEGDIAVLTREDVTILDRDGRLVQRPVVTSETRDVDVSKGAYRHFMLKEIHEQPTVIAQTLRSYLRPAEERVCLPVPDADLDGIRRIVIVACGTSYYAGMVARYWFERFAGLPVEIDFASEFRYRAPILENRTLAVFISQSGETADTLAALRHARESGQRIAVVVNVPTSSMAREADILLPIHAGPEIGVASTKAFTCQLATLAALVTCVAASRGAIDARQEADIVRALCQAPHMLASVLSDTARIEEMARSIRGARDVIYLGRGTEYPLALEGALKLKEISYIHAEGFSAGEMKHGPIALIDDRVPIVVLAPPGPLFEKTISNMQEAMARGGRVLLLSDPAGIAQAGEGCIGTLALPDAHPLVAPMLYAAPLQLLAYHVALANGKDVDQPRNLAKSVTVE